MVSRKPGCFQGSIVWPVGPFTQGTDRSMAYQLRSELDHIAKISGVCQSLFRSKASATFYDVNGAFLIGNNVDRAIRQEMKIAYWWPFNIMSLAIGVVRALVNFVNRYVKFVVADRARY